MAPMNNTAYRSLLSSILLPANDKLIIKPVDEQSSTLDVLFDGQDEIYSNISSIELCLSKRKINLVRMGDTTFWDKVKSKFL
jgi:NAD+ kinase